ncbi:hypothetical protein [Amycolatopsis anabasis]|uniref:hypothetical protein n=1 Tax=Amycolatopsis anabasis TaxID=1840409 RepID=UPI00131B2424|nr:hypothetical protein [Amycolatopsis anabasis]
MTEANRRNRGSRCGAPRFARGKFALVVAVTLLVTWIVVVTVLIARLPEAGVDSPEELRGKSESALNTLDAGQLEELVDYPPNGAKNFAKSYVDELRAAGSHDIAVTLAPDARAPRIVRVTGRRTDGSTFSFSVTVREHEGRWRLELTPPL